MGAPAKIKNSYTVFETGAKYEFSKNFVASSSIRADLNIEYPKIGMFLILKSYI